MSTPEVHTATCPQNVPFDEYEQHLQNQEHLDRRFPCGGWLCSVCDRSMALSGKASHLGGKKHAAAVHAQQERVAAATAKWNCQICKATVEMATKEAHLAGMPHAIQALKQPWHCNICDRSMTLAGKASHLIGKPHAAAFRLHEGGTSLAEETAVTLSAPEPIWTCDLCNVSVELARKDEHLATQLHLQMKKRQPWHCNVCDRTMPSAVKASHLEGKPHADAVAAAAGDPPKPSTANVLAATKTTNSNSEWNCDICNKTVGMANKDVHLAGRRHRASLAREPKRQPFHCMVCGITMEWFLKDSHFHGAEYAAVHGAIPEPMWTCDLCNVSVELVRKDAHLASKPHVANQRGQWYCETCDRIMLSGCKGSHLAGKPHAAAARKTSISPGPASIPNPTPESMWTCDLCTISMELSKRNEHLTSACHIAKQDGQWHCNLCERATPPGGQASHLARKPHSKRLKSSKAVRKNGNYYDEYEEGRQLLMDIDTQWGMIPGGGAYKDSDHYDPDMVRAHYGTWDW